MGDKYDPFDIENLALSSEQTAQLAAARAKRGRARPAQKSKLWFIKFPKIWWEALAAAHASGSTYRVAICLLYETTRAKTFQAGPPVVKLSSAALERWGVGRRGKVAALRALRKAGLVRVEERPKRSPLVIALFVD